MQKTNIENLNLVKKPLLELESDLERIEPKPIASFVPSNGEEQKAAFLNGEVRNPDHAYPRLEGVDYNKIKQDIEELGEQIVSSPELNPKFAIAYEDFIENYLLKNRLINLAHIYNSSTVDDEKAAAKDEFVKINIELYGEPDESIYRSLLNEQLKDIKNANLPERASQVRDELFELVNISSELESNPRPQPSEEAIAWTHEIVVSLFEGALSCVPDQVVFTKEDTKAVFEKILREVFEESAEDWVVSIEAAQSLNVKAAEKKIVIPETMRDLKQATMRKLIVHELGVHVLRSIIGEDTDLTLLKTGLRDYYDAEEGLGVVFEQALVGKYEERGIPHYITAGLVYYDHKDFRDTYEIKWRLNTLEKLKAGKDLTDESIDKTKGIAYNQVMRILRGTDELPWFKDLSYYNGAADIWKHIEEIKGDDIKLLFLLMGKADPSNIEHERLLYETRSS